MSLGWFDFFTAITAWVALLFTFSFHNYVKALAAVKLGDDTPARTGFLTPNPLVHVDPIGTVLVPLILLLSGSKFLIGWPKPVPINVEYFRRQTGKLILLTFISILAYFFVGFFGLLLYKTVQIFSLPSNVATPLLAVFQNVYVIGVFFGFLNLLPIPPLDMGIILFLLLGKDYYEIQSYSFWGMIVILFLFFSGILGHLFLPIWNLLGSFL
jgi:Zn-dependent protease